MAKRTTTTPTDLDELFTRIARQHLHVQTLETRGREDIATSLSERADRPAWLRAVGPVSLLIQIKSNGSGHWTPAAFKKVMEGKEGTPKAKPPNSTRVRPAEALHNEPGARFLFVTDAQVKVDLADLRLDELHAAGSRPDAAGTEKKDEPAVTGALPANPPAVPSVAGGAVEAALAPRVMIIDRHTRGHLRLLTERLLRDRLYVPTDEITSTIKDLCDEVRARLLEERPASRRWDRSQVSAVLERHGGRPDFSANPPPVYPTNHGVLVEQLVTRSALLLAGPTGVGKTILAEDLVGRAAQRGLDIKRPKTPSEVRHLIDRGAGAKLFYIEDPWGRYKAREGTDLWQEELPRLITRASPVNQFIITTRTGILDEVYPLGVPNALAAVTVRLDESHYPEDLRLRLLRQELKSVEAWRRDLLVGRERSIVSRLPVPLSLQVFASRLRDVKPDELSRVDLDKLVQASNVEAIGSALANEISAGGEGHVSAAVALWSLLMVRPAVMQSDVFGIAGLLSAGGWTGPVPEARVLVERLVASGAAAWAGDALQLHPTRLEGLELLTEKRQELSRSVVDAVLNGLLKRDGVEAASAAARALRSRKLPLPSKLKASLLPFLVKQLGSEDYSEARTAFDDLLSLDVDGEPVVALARALAEEARFPGSGFMWGWHAPELAQTQRDAIANSPGARHAAGVFVRQVLPNDSGIGRYRWKDLEHFFSGFDWDLSGECLAAAKEALAGRWNASNLDVLVDGALSKGSATAYDEIVKASLESEKEAEEWWEDHKEEYRQAMQGELDTDYSSFAADQPQERFYPSRVAFEALLGYRRKQDGFAWIKGDPLLEHLIRPWAEEVAVEAERAGYARENDAETWKASAVTAATPSPTRAEPSPAEWNALFDACNSELDVFWRAVARARYRGAAQRVIDAIPTLPTAGLPSWAEAAVAVLEPVADAARIAQAAAAEPPVSRARRLALAFWLRWQSHGDNATSSKVGKLNQQLLDGDGNDVLERCLRLMDDSRGKGDAGVAPPRPPPAPVVRLLMEVAKEVSHPLAGPALHTLVNAGVDAKDLVPAFLDSRDDDRRRPAFALAARYGSSPLRALVVNAVANDADHDCRRAAMWALAPDATPEEVTKILGRATDPSAPVRRDCATLIGERKWREGVPILVKLLTDTRNFGSSMVRGSADYAVARAAANALGIFEELPEDAIGGMINFLSTRTPRADPVVQYAVVDALAYREDPRLIPLFLKLLGSRARMDGSDDEGFPVRYAAAWALVAQCDDVSRYGVDTVNTIAVVADHRDARLAGPTIIALTLSGTPAHAALANAASRSPHRQDAAVLALIATHWVDAMLPPAVDQIVPTDHPVRPLLAEVTKHDMGSGHDVAEALKRWAASTPATAEWLAGVADGKGLHPAIRFALGQLAHDAGEVFVKWRDYRARDLARSVRVLTTWQMAGGT